MNFNDFEEGIEHILSLFERDELETLIKCNGSNLHFSFGI
jgi:hypothetical protein